MFYGDPRSYAWYGKRCVLYIRVSTDEQARHGYSLGAQQEALDAFVAQFNMQVVAQFADEGVSARKEVTRRPGLLKVLEVVRSGSVDYVLFIKLDRWFRSVREYYRVQDVLEAAGVNWKATLEDYDTTTTNGRLNLNIRLSVAQDESDRTSDRIKFVFEQRVKAGGAIAGSRTLPYALATVDHRVQVVEEQRAVVSGLFDRYEATGNAHGCVDWLRQQYGVSLPFNTIRRMLRNSLYAGRYRDNMAYCEAIVPGAQFDRVQAMLEAAAASHTRQSVHQYVFPGLIRCPVCGGTLKAHSGHDYKYNRIYSRYRCSACWQEHTCSYKGAVWEKRVEDWLLDHIEPELAQYVARFDVQEAQRRAAVVDTGKIERKIKRLQDMYLEELIEHAAYQEKYQALRAELAAAQEQKQQAVAVRDLDAVRQLLGGSFREIYEQLEIPERRALWASVVERINITASGHGKWAFSVVFL